jgi:hypothetical protein
MDKSVFVGFILLTFLFVGCVSSPPKNEDMVLFSPEGGGFSIMLPGTPVYKAQTYNSALGPVVSNEYVLDSGSRAYMIGYADYPDAMRGADPQVVLGGSRDGAVANVHGTLMFESPMSLNGYPGKDLIISIKSGGIRSRIYYAHNRLYTVMVSGPMYEMNSTLTNQVLDSFNFTAPSPEEVASSAAQGTDVQAY